MKLQSTLFILFLAERTFFAQTHLVPFSDQSGKIGFKNYKQQIVTQPKYKKLFIRDEIFVGNGHYIPREINISCDKTTKRILPDSVLSDRQIDKKISLYDLLRIKRYIFVSDSTGNYGIYDYKIGKEVTGLKYSHINILHNSRYEFLVTGFNNKSGIVDTSGKEIIPVAYKWVSEIRNSNNLFILNDTNDIYGIVNDLGREIVPIAYQYCYKFNDNVIFIYDQTKGWHFRDLRANRIPLVIDSLQQIDSTLYPEIDSRSFDFSQRIRVLTLLNGLKVTVDRNDKRVLGLYYEVIPENGQLKVCFIGNFENMRCGLVDSSGKEIIPLKYSDLIWYGNYGKVNTGGFFSEGTGKNHDGKWGIVDATGRELSAIKYVRIGEFNEGLAFVLSSDDKYGFIDKSGKEVIPMIYDSVDDFENAMARVRLGDHWFFIDKNGRKVKQE